MTLNKMTLSQKLDLLNLDDEERKKATAKFLAACAMIEDAEFREVVERLNSHQIHITKAKDIKVIANGLDDIDKKISIMSEAHELDMYRNEPARLNYNEVLKIYQRIQRCRQTGISYKRADGTYEQFLFDEYAWKKLMNERTESIVTPPSFTPVEEDIVTLEPIAENETQSIDELSAASTPEETPHLDDVHMDIKEYMDAAEDMKDIQAQTTDFATIRKELEDQLAGLDALRSELNYGDEISFSDLEPENFGGIRRA